MLQILLYIYIEDNKFLILTLLSIAVDLNYAKLKIRNILIVLRSIVDVVQNIKLLQVFLVF